MEQIFGLDDGAEDRIIVICVNKNGKSYKSKTFTNYSIQFTQINQIHTDFDGLKKKQTDIPVFSLFPNQNKKTYVFQTVMFSFQLISDKIPEWTPSES